MDLDGFRAWLEGYERAWRSYDREAAGRLFSEDALYYTTPFREPWRGRAAIATNWTRDEDDASHGFDFESEPVAVTEDAAVARCLVRYRGEDGSMAEEYSDLWVVRFDAQGQATEFTEWWVLRGPDTE